MYSARKAKHGGGGGVFLRWQNIWAELFKAGLGSVLILLVYKMMIGRSKNNRENYPRKCNTQEHKKKKPRLDLTPG